MVIFVFIEKLKRPSRYAAYAFSAIAIAVHAFFFIGWIVDHGSMATGSSTSALIFVFIPFYSIAAGCIASLLGVAIGTIHEFILQRRLNKAL